MNLKTLILINWKTTHLFLIILTIILTATVYSSDTKYSYSFGGIIRAERTAKKISLIFTGGDFGDGGDLIRKVLQQKKIAATFFFTGDFYRNPKFEALISGLYRDGHYLGAHSDKHLLYCDWENRDSLLITKKQFVDDLLANYTEMQKFGIMKNEARFFMPPYEWYNDSISVWAKELGITLVNYTPGTLSNADYTIPSMHNYFSTEMILNSIVDYEKKDPDGLNGFLLLFHIGTDPQRTDKFYYRLAELIEYLQKLGYSFWRIDKLLKI